MEFLQDLYKQLTSFYGTLTPVRRGGLVVVGVLICTTLAVMSMWAKEGEYVVLWSGIDPNDTQNIVNTLSSKKVPYQVSDGGSTIMVPRTMASELRMTLTSTGITSGGKIIGFEIFDKRNLGSTNYVQRINYRRALEGELTKSIKSLSGVEKVRVHLVIPESKTFLIEQKKATASVILKLFPGRVLDTRIVRGISNLVASGISGMQPEDVAVLDHKGRLLSGTDSDAITRISNDQLRYKTRLEQELSKRVSSILERVVGPENIEVRVSADVDFTKENVTKERFDPDGAVLLSQVSMNEKFNGSKANPSGIPGSRTNLPGQQANPQPNGTQHTSDRNTETTNYNVSKEVVAVTKPSANVKKLSVSVLVNSVPVKDKDGKITSYTKRNDLKELEVLAKNAIGFRDDRGDLMSIQSLAFKVEDFSHADNFLKEFTKNKLVRDLVWFGLVGTTILLFFFFVVRPFLNWLIDRTAEEEELPASVEEIESGTQVAALKEKTLVQLDDAFNPDKAESEALVEKIRLLVQKSPAKAVGALRPWINEGEQQ
jgi:flagellar M-ring protein FliF